MPPKQKKNILVIVTNIGTTSLELKSIEEEPFIDKAKYAVRILIEKKIFLQPKDEIGILTMGDETDNPDDIDYVKIYHENLLIPNWEMIKYVNGLSPTNNPSNWVEALHVALCFIRREVLDPEFRVFLVIFNNFKEDAESMEQYNSDIIVDDLKSYENLHLLFVGENPLNEKDWQKNSASPSEKFALSVMKETGAQYEEINNFIEARRFYVPPPTTSMAWKFELEFAGLSIPCSSYVKITDTSQKNSWKMQVVDETDDLLDNSVDQLVLSNQKTHNATNVVKENLKMDIHRNEVQPEDIINGYKFGGKYVPFSEEDELSMQYTGSTKGMMIYGFAPQYEVKLEYWTGSGSRIIVPASHDDARAFYSLVQAMVEKQYVAIVRKVYANNNLPKMGVLFPKVDSDNVWCLVHLELPYVQDLRVIQKRPIRSLDKIINSEKLEALDNFIDAMTVTDSKPTYLNPGMFPNVRNQYEFNAIVDRALKPENTLLSLNNYLQKYLIPPEDLSIKAKPHLEKLNKLFEFCKNNKNTDKQRQTITTASTTKANAEDVNEPVVNVIKDKSSVDEGFFTPEVVYLKMEELDDM